MAGAINLAEYKNRVNALLTNLPNEVSQANEGIAFSAIQLIRDRLVNTGVDGTGKAFGKYSSQPLPTFFFKGQATGSGADDKLQALIKRKRKQEGKAYKGVSYEEFREINNLPTVHITMSFTGETLADIGVVNVRTEEKTVIATIGAKGEKTKAKYKADGSSAGTNTTEQILDYLGARYGENILAVNEEEGAVLAGAFDDELQMILNKYLEG